MKLRTLATLVIANMTLLTSAHAQMGLCDQPLPSDQVRKLGRQWVTCDGAGAEVIRTPRKIENFEEWQILEAKRDRTGMQNLRLKEPAPEWKTELAYPVTEYWTWVSYHERDGYTCGYDRTYIGQVSVGDYQRNYNDSSRYDAEPVTEDIIERYQYCPPPPPPEPTPNYGSDSGSSRGGSSGGGSTYTPPPTNEHETSDSFSGHRKRDSETDKIKDDVANRHRDKDSKPLPSSETKEPPKRRKSSYIIQIINTRMPSQECEWRTRKVGERTIAYRVTKKDPRSCEVQRTGSRSCGQQKMDFTLRFQKPEASWKPCTAENRASCDQNYHDVLPNKYDLLPGEIEKFWFVSNKGANTTINPQMGYDEKLAWNRYQQVPVQPIACKYGARPNVVVEVKTLGRIKKKSPNALVIPVNIDGSEAKLEDYVKSNQHWDAGQKKFLFGRPTKLILQDTSNQMVLAAARHSRNLRSEFQFTGDQKVLSDDRSKIGTPQTMGFWKDTQFRITLKEKRLIGRDIEFTNPQYTKSSQTQTVDDKVIFPLEGERGIHTLYKAKGPLNTLLLNYLGTNDSHLTPGNTYEMRVSMYQRGLPFYISGCRNEAECEDEKANNNAFSSELVVEFVADKNVDERNWAEKLQDWWRAPLWKKMTWQF